MRTSPAGVALIKQFEGFPFGGRPYRDAVGVWTIGYGHTRGVGPHRARITERQASELLINDLETTYERPVEQLPTAGELNQHQFDALVSFVYNLGPGSIGPHTGIGRALRTSEWSRAADEMLRWDKAGGRVLAGLTRRRAAERKLFLRPAERDPSASLHPREREWCREYDRLLELKRQGPDSIEHRRRRVALRRAMERRRKAIWHAARGEPEGWARANRRARYSALRARTT